MVAEASGVDVANRRESRHYDLMVFGISHAHVDLNVDTRRRSNSMWPKLCGQSMIKISMVVVVVVVSSSNSSIIV